jgi:hypothetical protein
MGIQRKLLARWDDRLIEPTFNVISRRDIPRCQVVCADAMDFRRLGISVEIGGGSSSVLQGIEELYRAKSGTCGDIHLNRLCCTQASASASSRSRVEDRRDFRIDCRGSDQDHVRRGCHLSRFRYPCMNLQQSLLMPDWLGNHTLDQEVAAAAPDAIAYGVDTVQEDVKSLVDIGMQVDGFVRRAGV